MALQSGSREINLIIEGQVFKVYQNVLCEHSDYFSAMFSGNYVEQDKTDITIDVVDAESMDIIMRYINAGLIDLSEYSLPIISKLAMAANFLQITELNKQIEYWLDLQLTESNCIEIMTIAEKASYLKLEQYAGSFALLNFKTMQPKYIPNLQKLFWYLSHPYLDAANELEVFKFGYTWILNPQTCICADVLLMVLTCIDTSRLTCQDLKEIVMLMDNCENSLAAKVVECFKMLLDNKLEISVDVLEKFAQKIRESFSERVFNEVYNLVLYSNERKLEYTPVAAVWMYKDGDMAFAPHYLYTFTKNNEYDNKFESWLEVADKNIWGWNMATWGATKIVIACGEYGRGIGRFVNDVKIYDTLRQEWIQHGVKLPSRRHVGLAIIGDTMFIVGGVGPYRVIEDSTIVYDLKDRSYRKAAKFPEAIQSPAICAHFGSIYASGQRHVYKFEDRGHKDAWVPVLETNNRPTYMISYKDYIYCSQNYFDGLYRFRPGIDDKMEIVTHFRSPPVAYCNMGNYLLAFCRSRISSSNELSVEEYRGPCMCPLNAYIHYPSGNCCLQTIWSSRNSDIAVNEVTGACTLVMSMPKVNMTPSSYHQRYINQYGDITFNKGLEDDDEET